MKTIDINSKILLRSVIRKLIESMELLNKISEEEFRKIVLASQKQKKVLHNISENAEGRGNSFMMLFFIRELIESLLNTED